jgi:hypothetical protein
MVSHTSLTFHGHLNPRLWRNETLRPEARLKLFQAAVAFYRFLDVPHLVVRDIILTGSNAAYNYTRLSDVDVHLLVSFSHTTCPALASNFFNTKKSLWSKTYDVTMRGHTIELYVEDTAEPVKANGVYSILHALWLKSPSKVKPTFDDTAVEAKVSSLADEIDSLLNGEPAVIDIDQMLRKLYTLRSNGLLNGGEFSTENLAFKTLRNLGHIDKLHAKRIELRDKKLSF